MKRSILSLLTILLSLSWGFSLPALASCDYSEGSSVLESISEEGCRADGSIDTDGDYSVASIKDRVIQVSNNIIILGSLVAIGGIVYSSFLFLFSGGDNGKAKNGRMGIIYSLAGFAAMLLAFPVVNALINFVFDLE